MRRLHPSMLLLLGSSSSSSFRLRSLTSGGDAWPPRLDVGACCLVGAAVYDDAMTLARGRSARTCFGGACPTVATSTGVGVRTWALPVIAPLRGFLVISIVHNMYGNVKLTKKSKMKKTA